MFSCHARRQHVPAPWPLTAAEWGREGRRGGGPGASSRLPWRPEGGSGPGRGGPRRRRRGPGEGCGGRALRVDFHGVRRAVALLVGAGLGVAAEVLARDAVADVLAQGLDGAHVLEPLVVLLLALAGGVADVRLGRGRAHRGGG